MQIVAVPTLTVLAHNALDAADPPAQLGVILDAKRGQTYAAAFNRSGDRYTEHAGPSVCDPRAFVEALEAPRTILGEGIPYHQAALEDVEHTTLPDTLWRPRAEWVHRLGWDEARRGRFAAAAELIPLYLRIPEAEEVWIRRQGHA